MSDRGRLGPWLALEWGTTYHHVLPQKEKEAMVVVFLGFQEVAGGWVGCVTPERHTEPSRLCLSL